MEANTWNFADEVTKATEEAKAEAERLEAERRALEQGLCEIQLANFCYLGTTME